VSWFKRLADVPGVSYTSSSSVNRTQLPEHDSVPQKREFDSTDVQTHHLRWPDLDNGTTSTSPAWQYALEGPNEIQDLRRVLLELHEVLELPGTMFHYHLAIESAYKTIYERRREDLAMLEEVERLCWLDIELSEAYARLEHKPGTFFLALAFEGLASLYETEGDFAAALEVAERGMRLGQEYRATQVERLRAILAELEAEDMP
jgi:hypothetical protein